jgi:hypothetical protein
MAGVSYYFGPWVWDTAELAEGGQGFWRPPEGCSSGLDLRPLPAQAARESSSQNWGIFVAESDPPKGDYVLVADAGGRVDPAALDFIAHAMGLSAPPKAEGIGGEPMRIGELLHELLTTHSDPACLAGPKPLMPNSARTMEIILGGERLFTRAFVGEADAAWPQILAVKQDDYRAASEAIRPKLLTDWCDKLGITDHRVFIPSDLPIIAPGPLSTSYSDDFNRAALGTDWTAVRSTWDIYNSVEIHTTGSDYGNCRYEFDLSSDDHEATLTATYVTSTANGWIGPSVRHGSAGGCYTARVGNTTRSIMKQTLAGGNTVLVSDSGGGALPHVIRLTVDATALTSYDDGVQALQTTDTTYSGATRCGVAARSGAGWQRGDNWSIADLAAAITGTGDPATQLQAPASAAGTQMQIASGDNAAQLQVPADGVGSQAHVTSGDPGAQLQVPASGAGTQAHVASGDPAAQLQVPASAAGSQAHVASGEPATQLQVPADGSGSAAGAVEGSGDPAVQAQAPASAIGNTYFPNSSGSTGWKGFIAEGDLPSTPAAWKQTELTGAEKDETSADNGTNTSLTDYYDGELEVWMMGGFLFEINIGSEPLTQLTSNFNLHANAGDSCAAKIWNWITGAWDAIGSGGGAPGSDYDLNLVVSSAPAKYRSSGNLVRVLCYSDATDQGISLDQVRVEPIFTVASASGDPATQLQEPGAPAGVQQHVTSADSATQVQAPASGTGSQVHVASGDPAAQLQVPADASGESPKIGIADGAVQLQEPGAPAGSQQHVTSADSAAQLQVPAGATGAQAHVASGDGAVQLQVPGAPSMVEVQGTADGAVQLQTMGDAEAHMEVALSLSLPGTAARRLSWEISGTVYITADGQVIAESATGYVDLPADFGAREKLIAYRELFDPFPGPLDEVELAWTESASAERYEIWRHPAGEDPELIAEVGGLSFTDGPLDSGTWHYEVYAEDAEGDDSAPSNEATVAISTAPDAPSGLTSSWNAATKTWSLAWTASPSATCIGYRIYSSEGEELLELGGTPYDTTALTSWSRVFTTESGTYLVLIRAYDGQGREDANISQVASIGLSAGVLVSLPAEPRLVGAESAAGGKICVDWLYDPRYEVPSKAGAAHEARIYWDAGTGTMDWDEPHATVALSHPTSAARGSWTSAALTDGDYQFCVRIGTDAWPAGLETSNSDLHAATANDDVPTAPILTAQVV